MYTNYIFLFLYIYILFIHVKFLFDSFFIIYIYFSCVFINISKMRTLHCIPNFLNCLRIQETLDMFTFYFCIFFYKKYCFICIPKIFLFFLLSETLYLLYMYSFLQKKSKLSLKSGDTRYVSFFVFYIFFKSNKHNNSYKNKIRTVEYKNRRILTCGGGENDLFYKIF